MADDVISGENASLGRILCNFELRMRTSKGTSVTTYVTFHNKTNYMLKSKLSLSRHFEYANKQITYHFWLWDLPEVT
jgi:hypothetical protein